MKNNAITITPAKNHKTVWQKIYSFFGFWKYYWYSNKGEMKTIYWCCLPWFKYFRKFDLFSYCGKPYPN